MKGTKMGTMKEIALDDPEISNYVTDEAKAVLEEEIELLDGASAEFDQELVDAGELSPVIFWFCPHELWCGKLLKLFPENDFFSTAKNF